MYGTQSPRTPPAGDVHLGFLHPTMGPYQRVDTDDTNDTHQYETPRIHNSYTSYQSVPQSYSDLSTAVSPTPSSLQLKEPPFPPVAEKKSIFASRNTEWRSFPLKLPFLLFFALITIILIVCAELLLRRSQAHGAVLFTSEAKGRIHIEYLLNYGPLAVGVLYGLLFVSIDHDVKRQVQCLSLIVDGKADRCRLEPYFQLSKPGGVTAENSLLLEYPYVLSFSVPFIAVRKK
jgi:hypothetical protein